MAELEQPIIIKKIKKGGDGHHGGAWKVAYADFVTAMMAFFLLLWLLASTSDATKEGIAEYFTPTIGLKDAMGIGFEGGEKPTEEGKDKDDMTPPGIVIGMPQQGPVPTNPKGAMIEGDKESKLFEKAEEAIKKAFESDPNLNEIRDQIIVEQTPEGLKIELLNDGKKEMFLPGNAKLTEFGRMMLNALLKVVKQMPNHISITGHTDAEPFSKSSEYGNWELSTDRANAARRYFLLEGMEPERTSKVVGRADQELLVPTEPKSPRNRRITIILLRGSHMTMPLHLQPASRSLLSIPKVDKLTGKAAPVPAPERGAPATRLPALPSAPAPAPKTPPAATDR